MWKKGAAALLIGFIAAAVGCTPRVAMPLTTVGAVQATIIARPHAESLFLSGPEIDDAVIALIVAEAPHIERLYILDSDVTDAAMVNVNRLGNLRALTLRNAKITDVGVLQLTRLERLESLDISRNAVTVTALDCLRFMPAVTDLFVDGTSITVDDVELAFKKHHGKPVPPKGPFLFGIDSAESMTPTQ